MFACQLYTILCQTAIALGNVVLTSDATRCIQVPMFGTSVACDLAFTDYHTVAQGYGGKGFLVKDIKDYEKTLREAQKALAAGSPVLINALIGKTSFRDGSISV